MTRFGCVFAVVAMVWGPASAQTTPADSVLSTGQTSHAIALRNVVSQNGAVKGQIVNKGLLPVENVRLLIRQNWLWQNERNPGQDNPGRARYHTVRGKIRPGATLSFSYQPDPPLPSRTDGRFETLVDVVGFTELSGESEP